MYKVALVDDENLILAGLKKVMPWESLGCVVVGTAADGMEGISLIRREKPDMVFTDIRMPNMDGLMMLAALKSEFPRMQITVLTAFRDFDYAQRAITLGVCRFLLKPSKMDELKEAVCAMISRLDDIGKSAPLTNDPPADGSEAGSFIVRAALQYMREHCVEHLSLGDVADGVYVSQWHLSKLINRHTGRSFLDLLGGMRIERAKLLLTDPTLRVHAVAEAVGYSDVANFSKTFKKITGKTPGEYRALLRVGSVAE